MKPSITTAAAFGALGLSTAAVAITLWRAANPADTTVGPEAAREQGARQTPPPSPVSPASEPASREPEASAAKAPTQAAPKQSPAPSPADPETDAADLDIKIKRLVVTDRIEAREPGASPSLSPDGTPIFAFLELRNSSETDRQVVVTFEHATGRTVGHIQLAVPAKKPRWRTWAKTALVREPGDWTAVVSTRDGSELARTEFVVTG